MFTQVYLLKSVEKHTRVPTNRNKSPYWAGRGGGVSVSPDSLTDYCTDQVSLSHLDSRKRAKFTSPRKDRDTHCLYLPFCCHYLFRILYFLSDFNNYISVE